MLDKVTSKIVGVLLGLLLSLTPATVVARAPASVGPTVINETNSLKVEKLEITRRKYTLSLHNTSPSGTAGVAVLVVGSRGVCDLRTPEGARGPLIPAGSTTIIELDIPRVKPEHFGPGGESCADAGSPSKLDRDKNAALPRSSAIVIAAADFEDGTYEGDQSKAAMMGSMRLGIEAERELIANVVEKELRSGSSGDSAKIGAIRVKIGSLPERPEPALVRSTMDRFSFLPENASASVQGDLQAGLSWPRATFLVYLKLYTLEVSKGLAPRESLQQWWDATKGQCDWLAMQYCEDRR
jgi:hypothetical protein